MQEQECVSCNRPFRWPAGFTCQTTGSHAPPFTPEETARLRAAMRDEPCVIDPRGPMGMGPLFSERMMLRRLFCFLELLFQTPHEREI